MDKPAPSPAAGLSLDLDNLWSYLRSYGDAGWQSYPGFLEVAVPRIIRTLAQLDLKATIFIVGRDAANPAYRELLHELVTAGHEIGNHSWDHAPDFRHFTADRLQDDFARSEAALTEACAATPRGFRAPNFALTTPALEQLLQRHYLYDSSLFPTSLGPVARAWERLNYRRESSASDRETYGSFRAARGSLRPFAWRACGSTLLELPVTTMPWTRFPVHWTYLNFIATRSISAAHAYLKTHIALLRRYAIEPQLILHSTDFLGLEDKGAPTFVPGMKLPVTKKLEFVAATLARYGAAFRLLPIERFINEAVDAAALSGRSPDALIT